MDTVIRVRNVNKSFRLYFDKGSNLKEKLLFKGRRRFEEHEVLSKINFDIKKGEAVGIIGENGCGKSTMLKLLTRIMYPDAGSIEVKGRVSALIELGAGFHPDMSGRENIYTNAAIFGLTKKEIDARIQSIIQFSELGPYIDNPVRTYSSGMYMRLAFAVAINVDADVLLVDEILAVGDASFQAKCFHKLREVKAKGTTIVIVSHSLGQIEQFCDRSIWIKDGTVFRDGTPRDIHPEYLSYMGKKTGAAESQQVHQDEGQVRTDNNDEAPAASAAEVTAEENRWGNGAAKITNVQLLDSAGNIQHAYQTGSQMTIEIEYEAFEELSNPAVGFGIFRDDGVHCYGTNTQIEHIKNVKLEGRGKVLFKIDELMLLPGKYSLDVALHTEDGFAFDYYRYAKEFSMYSDCNEAGIVRLGHEWQLM